MADKEVYLPVEIQHELLSPLERDTLMQAIMNATVDGHKGFRRVLLTIMGFTVGGRITTAQAEVLTKQCELLFTDLCADRIEQQAAGQGQGPSGDVDPLVARLKASQAGAAKIRPNNLLSQDGNHEMTLEVIDAKGKPATIARVKLPSQED